MDRKSPTSPVPYERYKSRCAWSLIRLCDFRQDHSNVKLISDRKGLNSHFIDDKDMKNRHNLLSNHDGSCQCSDDGVNNKNMKIDSAMTDTIREEEMTNEQQISRKSTTTRMQRTLSDSLPLKNRKRKANKSFHLHGCRNIAIVEHTQPSHVKPVEISAKKSNTAALVKASKDSSCGSANLQKHDQLGAINSQALMNEAAEIFINQKFISGIYLGKEEASHQSQHLLDALNVLNSNQDLFKKLLQDPNSLLVKHIQDLRDFKENEQRTKSFSEATSSDTIVLLKPGLASVQNSDSESGTDCSSPRSLYSLRNRPQSTNSTKHAFFSFELVKRKLKHAIGLNRKEKSNDCMLLKASCEIQGLREGAQAKRSEAVNPGRISKYSPNGKRKDNRGKVNDVEFSYRHQVASSSGCGHDSPTLSVVRDLRHRETKISVESKKSFSETLRNVEDSRRKQVSKSLGRIIDQSEYNLFSARNPGRHIKDGFMAGEMRFSPYHNYQMASDKKWRHQKEKKNEYLGQRQINEASSRDFLRKPTEQLQIFYADPNVSGDHHHDIDVGANFGSLGNTSNHAGSLKVVKTYNGTIPGEINPGNVSAAPNEAHVTDKNQSTGSTDSHEENGCLDCSKMDRPFNSHSSLSSKDVYSPSPSSIKILEDSDGMKDKAEQSSPVSVLEQLLIEDINSPPRTISKAAERSVEPKQINREELCSAALHIFPIEPKIISDTVMDEHQLMSNHVASLLQASGISWDELSKKCCSSDQLLNPSLFDECEVLPNQFSGNLRLFVEYLNEILLEVCQYYFSSSPWLLSVGTVAKPIRVAKNLLSEVMKRVDCHIISQQSPVTSEQLVGKDLAKPGSWMDVQVHIEDAIYEMVESLLEELTLETAVDLHI